MIIKEIDHEKGKIYIHDDCMVKTPEERKEIMQRVSQIVVDALRKKQSDKTAWAGGGRTSRWQEEK